MVARKKTPTARTPKVVPADVRRAVVQECLEVLLDRERILLVESDQAFFHGKLDARVEELHEVKKEIIKLLPQSEDPPAEKAGE